MNEISLSDFTIINGKDALLVTMGDSWTWGNRLVNRQVEVYGKILADRLDADLFNIAMCGRSNFWILDNLYKLVLANTADIITEDSYNKIRGCDWPQTHREYLEQRPIDVYEEIKQFCSHDVYEHKLLPRYKDIFIVITLTETGREFNDLVSSGLDTIDDYLRDIEQTFFDKVKKITEHSSVKILIGRNFSINYPTTRASNMLDKNWIEIIYDSCTDAENNFFKKSDILHHGPISGIGLDFLHSNHPVLGNMPVKEYFVNQSSKVKKIIEYLSLHGSYHRSYPCPEAHRLWAEYIIKNLAP